MHVSWLMNFAISQTTLFGWEDECTFTIFGNPFKNVSAAAGKFTAAHGDGALANRDLVLILFRPWAMNVLSSYLYFGRRWSKIKRVGRRTSFLALQLHPYSIETDVKKVDDWWSVYRVFRSWLPHSLRHFKSFTYRQNWTEYLICLTITTFLHHTLKTMYITASNSAACKLKRSHATSAHP